MKPQFIEQDESPSPQSLKENFQKKFKKGKRGREKKRKGKRKRKPGKRGRKKKVLGLLIFPHQSEGRPRIDTKSHPAADLRKEIY